MSDRDTYILPAVAAEKGAEVWYFGGCGVVWVYVRVSFAGVRACGG